MEIMYTPVNPSFTTMYIKVGCKGVYITWTCLHDAPVIMKLQIVCQRGMKPCR